VTCDRCYRPLDEGKHGWMLCPLEPRRGFMVIDDQLEGGPRRFETLGHDAPYIESKSQLRREAEARGLIPVGDRKPASYFARQRKRHDEELRELGRNVEY
jgi:hypothetical protein